MFTGIVLERGRLIADPERSPRGGILLRIGHSAQLGARLEPGASLAVAGVCLTLIEWKKKSSVVELSPETLARTRLGRMHAGDHVNLEPSLRVGDALGGHWVQGHVDGVGEVVGRAQAGEHRALTIAAPAGLGRYLVEKGSVAVDGVSLTVASCDGDRFTVALIPHTLEVTTLGGLATGDRVNLEIDVLAKYVARQVAELLGGAVSGSEATAEAAARTGEREPGVPAGDRAGARQQPPPRGGAPEGGA
jgi:riboflavin synthase alpha subunit